MNADSRRATLVLTGSRSPFRLWNDRLNGVRLIFVGNIKVLRYAVGSMEHFEEDVQRIIIDHSASAAEQLRFLSELPDTFHGDVLLLGAEGMYLSAAARGDGRKTWELHAADVEFYLREHRLVISHDMIPLVVPPAERALAMVHDAS